MFHGGLNNQKVFSKWQIYKYGPCSMALNNQRVPPNGMVLKWNDEVIEVIGPLTGAFNLLVARPTECTRTAAILVMHPTGKSKDGLVRHGRHGRHG